MWCGVWLRPPQSACTVDDCHSDREGAIIMMMEVNCIVQNWVCGCCGLRESSNWEVWRHQDGHSPPGAASSAVACHGMHLYLVIRGAPSVCRKSVYFHTKCIIVQAVEHTCGALAEFACRDPACWCPCCLLWRTNGTVYIQSLPGSCTLFS